MTDCRGQLFWGLGWRALAALGAALWLGWSVRSLARWLGRRRAEEPGAAPEAGIATPGWALAGIPLSILGGLFAVWLTLAWGP